MGCSCKGESKPKTLNDFSILDTVLRKASETYRQVAATSKGQVFTGKGQRGEGVDCSDFCLTWKSPRRVIKVFLGIYFCGCQGWHLLIVQLLAGADSRTRAGRTMVLLRCGAVLLLRVYRSAAISVLSALWLPM